MKTFHMVDEHSRALDLDGITSKLMLSPGSKNNNNRGTVEEIIKVRKGLKHLKIKGFISCQKTKGFRICIKRNFMTLKAAKGDVECSWGTSLHDGEVEQFLRIKTP